MKKLIAIVIKDTLVRFTSPVEWLFFLILPIIFTVIIGASTGPGDGRVKLYIVDQADNALSENIISALEKSSTVVPEIKPLEDALSEFDQRKISTVLVIPVYFNEDALLNRQAELDLHLLPNNVEAMVAEQAVQAVLTRVSSVVDIASASVSGAEKIPGFKFESTELRQAYFKDALSRSQTLMAEAPVRFREVQGNTTDTFTFDSRTNASAGQLITWVFIPLIGLSATFAYERQKGTLRRLLTTPTSKALYLGGTITGQVITALFQALLLVLFGQFVMQINWGREPVALAVMLIASTLAAAAFGTMLGAFVKTEGQANGLSIMSGMVMALMGGCWYPMELFPQAVQNAVKVLPTTWSMQGLLDILLRGHGLIDILPEAGVLLGFALLFFVIGILRFKYE